MLSCIISFPWIAGPARNHFPRRARARNVVLEFESFEQAKKYYHSAEYQAAKALREGAAIMEMVLVEGA